MSSRSLQGTAISYTASDSNTDRELHIGFENNQFALTINEIPRWKYISECKVYQSFFIESRLHKHSKGQDSYGTFELLKAWLRG